MMSSTLLAIVFAAALSPIVQGSKSCETENYEEGICLPIRKCEAFGESFATRSVSAGQRNLARREQDKCADTGIAGLVCCKRKPRRTVPVTWEDVKVQEDRDRHNLVRLLPDQSVCGTDNADRIFHGNVTSLAQYPWLVVIKYIDGDENELFKCGGSVINSRYVLTAAHCIEDSIAEVRLGEWDLETDPDCVTHDGREECADPVQDVPIEKILMHKNYRRRVSQGGKIDLALLRLEREVSFGRYVAPICLPLTDSQATLATGETFYVAGWGMTELGTTSTKKLFTDVHNVELDECRRKINAPLIKIDETMICALGVGGKDTCQGDSGGSLMAIEETDGKKKRFFLKGVVSKGLSCGADTKPGFYTNVHKQMEWIISNMEP